MIRTIVAAAMLVAAAASCTSPETAADTAGASVDPTASPLAPSPATSPDAPSIAQFASVVAEHHAEWDKQVAKVEEACGNPETVIACMLGYTTLGIQGETINIVLSSSHDPSSGTYLGEPPTEVADLLAETEEAAAAVTPAYGALSATGCKDPLEDVCAREYLDLMQAVDKVTSKLNAWGPYS